MLKTFVTLMRGAAAAAEEEVADRHALLVLDQQIRDAAAAVEGGQRALALAMAGEAGETRRLARLDAEVADLEARAVAALQGGREDLAAAAADALAALAADRDAGRETQAAAAAEVEALRRAVADAGRRLAELRRGRRVAQAAEAVRRLRAGRVRVEPGARGSLADAEATLRRLRERQAEEAAMHAALAVVEAAASGSAETVAARLGAHGFGRPTRPTAAGVLERLKARAAAPVA